MDALFTSLDIWNSRGDAAASIKAGKCCQAIHEGFISGVKDHFFCALHKIIDSFEFSI